jgi:hypothetical protein
MTISTEEEYTFKVTLVFWKFYELGLYFELPKVRKYLEKEGIGVKSKFQDKQKRVVSR